MENAIAYRTKVFLVEDSPAIRVRLAEMLGKIASISIVGQADTPASAIDGILHTRPHCVVLDIKLVGGSGIEVLRQVKPAHPSIAFIMLTNHAEPQYRKICMAHGASYFLDKSSEFEKIKDLILELKTKRIHEHAISDAIY